MSQVQAQRLQRTISITRIVIIVLVVITALVHLQRGIGMSMGGFGGPPPGGGGQGGPPPGGGAGRPPGGFNIFQYLPLSLPVLFLLNGIGYLVLGTALYLPALARYRPTIRLLLILFAAATITMYLLVNGFRLNPLGIVDKIAEIALIVLLIVDGRQSSSSGVVEAVRT